MPYSPLTTLVYAHPAVIAARGAYLAACKVYRAAGTYTNAKACHAAHLPYQRIVYQVARANGATVGRARATRPPCSLQGLPCRRHLCQRPQGG